MVKLKSRITFFDLSCLMLSLLIVSINIREPFFHTREILYVLTIATSFTYMDIKKSRYAIYLITIWAISVTYNLIVPGSNIDFSNGGFETIIISAYILLLCFYQDKYAKVIIKSYNTVSIIVALITISIWIMCYMSESTFYSLRSFFLTLEETTGLSLIAIDRRAILGTRVLAVWYRTAPCMTCSIGYYLSQRLSGKKQNTLKIVLLFVALIFSGTRANILSALLLIGFYVGFGFYKRGFRITPIILFSTALITATVFVIRFINDRYSMSSTIKVLDTFTYFDIYKRDFFRTLLFGYGPGSTFFSRGRQMYVNVTENSLLETIRRYGLISTGIILGGIWFIPFKSKGFKEKVIYLKLFYVCVFGAYMLSALSNPYLLDSVGFCALLFFCTMFSYDNEQQYENIETLEPID